MQDAFEAGVIGKRTMREFDECCLTRAEPLSPLEIQKLRERELLALIKAKGLDAIA